MLPTVLFRIWCTLYQDKFEIMFGGSLHLLLQREGHRLLKCLTIPPLNPIRHHSRPPETSESFITLTADAAFD